LVIIGSLLTYNSLFIFLICPKASSYQRPFTKSTMWVPKKRKEVDDADAD